MAQLNFLSSSLRIARMLPLPRPNDLVPLPLHFASLHFTCSLRFSGTERREDGRDGGRGRERERIALAVGWHPHGSAPVAARLLPPPPPPIERVACYILPSVQIREREREREREGESQKSVVLVTRCHCPAHLSSTLLANLLHSGAAPAIDLDERPKRATSVGGQSRRRERVGR